MSEQSIRDILNKYSDKHTEMVAQEQEKLILKGCGICGEDLVAPNNEIINGAVILKESTSIIGVPVCSECRINLTKEIEVGIHFGQTKEPLWCFSIWWKDENKDGDKDEEA